MTKPRRTEPQRPAEALARLLLVLGVASGCVPSFEDDPGLVTVPRVLTVEAFPAEVRPGEDVTLTAHIADESGPLAEGAVAWRFCAISTPYTEEGPVDSRCLDDSTAALGTGLVLSATVPPDACSVWGTSTAGTDSRPRDPDSTGGFFQPVLLDAFGEYWVHLQRIECALPDLSRGTAREFAATYVANRNPVVRALEGRNGSDGAPIDWAAVAPETTVVLRVAWPPESAEDYAWVEPGSRMVRTRHEALQVSWLTTAGRLSDARTGVDEAATTAMSTTRWTAPPQAGTAHLWAVLRDSRGGTAIAHQTVTLR